MRHYSAEIAHSLLADTWEPDDIESDPRDDDGRIMGNDEYEAFLTAMWAAEDARVVRVRPCKCDPVRDYVCRGCEARAMVEARGGADSPRSDFGEEIR